MSTTSGDSEREKIAIEVSARATAIRELREVAEVQNTNIALLTESVSTLAAAVQARPTHRETLSVVSVSSVITLLIVGLLFFLQYRADGHARQTLETNERSLDLLLECTTETPEGEDDEHECYARSEERTSTVIERINLVTIFAADCAIGTATGQIPETVSACVARKLMEYDLEREKQKAELERERSL